MKKLTPFLNILMLAGCFASHAQWQALPSPVGLVINDVTYHDSRFFLSTTTGVYTLHSDEDEVKYYDMGIEGVKNVNFFYVKSDAELFVGTDQGITSYTFFAPQLSDRVHPIRIFFSNHGDFSFLSREVIIPAKPDLYWEASDKAEILSFVLEEAMSSAELDSINQKFRIVIVDTTDITSLAPFIEISDHATISPAPELPQDFTLPFTYIVTASKGNAKEWIVEVVTYYRSSENDILEFSVPQQLEAAVIDAENHNVSLVVEGRTTIGSLLPTIVISDNATINPPSSVRQDFRLPVLYTITSENGIVQDWEVHVSYGPLATEVLREGQLKVYPNPGKQYLSIDGYPRPMKEIQITDVTGKIYQTGYEEAGNSIKINIGNLRPGSYFLTMKSAEKVFYTRFIKE